MEIRSLGTCSTLAVLRIYTAAVPSASKSHRYLMCIIALLYKMRIIVLIMVKICVASLIA